MLPQVQCCWATNYYKTGVHIEIPMKILFWTGQNEKLYYSNVAISFPVITYRWESTVLYFTRSARKMAAVLILLLGIMTRSTLIYGTKLDWRSQSLWKICVRQLGVFFPTEWKHNPNVPNHQPHDIVVWMKSICAMVKWHVFFLWFFWSSICHPSHNGNSPFPNIPNYWLDNPASRAKRHPGECGSIPLADCRFLSSTKRWITHIKCREHGVYSC